MGIWLHDTDDECYLYVTDTDSLDDVPMAKIERKETVYRSYIYGINKYSRFRDCAELHPLKVETEATLRREGKI